MCALSNAQSAIPLIANMAAQIKSQFQDFVDSVAASLTDSQHELQQHRDDMYFSPGNLTWVALLCAATAVAATLHLIGLTNNLKEQGCGKGPNLMHLACIALAITGFGAIVFMPLKSVPLITWFLICSFALYHFYLTKATKAILLYLLALSLACTYSALAHEPLPLTCTPGHAYPMALWMLHAAEFAAFAVEMASNPAAKTLEPALRLNITILCAFVACLTSDRILCVNNEWVFKKVSPLVTLVPLLAIYFLATPFVLAIRLGTLQRQQKPF